MSTGVDLAAVQDDDALLDQLTRIEGTPSRDELARLLAAWRRQIRAELVAELALLFRYPADARAGGEGR